MQCLRQLQKTFGRCPGNAQAYLNRKSPETTHATLPTQTARFVYTTIRFAPFTHGSVTSNKDLKDSQTYPRAFGQAIGLCYSQWRRAPNHVIQELASTVEQAMDMWEDAELESLASLCGVPTDRYPWE